MLVWETAPQLSRHLAQVFPAYPRYEDPPPVQPVA